MTTTTVHKLNYRRLTPAARMTIRNRGLTIAQYVRDAGRCGVGDWHGDECGCTDDRCIDYHHDAHEDCQCLPAIIDNLLGWSFPGSHEPLNDYPTHRDGSCAWSYVPRPDGQCPCGYAKAAS